MNEMHEANRRSWDAAAKGWGELRDQDQLWRQCPKSPEIAFEGQALEMMLQYVGDLSGKRICVIGSGDNYASFAFAGLGANVTSVDISEKQLSIAEKRAQILDLQINFVCADAANLEALAVDSFDLVCSTNGFYVWISEPMKVMTEICRILRPGGYYVFYDIHPFQRPWKQEPVRPLEMAKSYWDTGPFEDTDDSVTYEFTWTLSDLLNPLLDSGLLLRKMIESPPMNARFWQDFSYETGTDDRLMDWKFNPRAGLPTWLTVTAQKP